MPRSRTQLDEDVRRAIQKAVQELVENTPGRENGVAERIGFSQQAVNQARKYARAGYDFYKALLGAMHMTEATFMERYGDAKVSSPTFAPTLTIALGTFPWDPYVTVEEREMITKAAMAFTLRSDRGGLSVEQWRDMIATLQERVLMTKTGTHRLT